MRKLFFFAVIIAALTFVACENNESVSPSTKTTQLWPAYHSDYYAYGYIDKDGKWVIEPIFQNAYPFSCGLAKVTMDGFTYFINEDGDLVEGSIIPAKTSTDDYFMYDFIRFKQDNLYGLMDKNFNIILPAQFSHVGPMTSDGLVCVQKEKKDLYGYYNKEGEEVIAPRFSPANDFLDGYATVHEGFVYYVINTEGDTLWNSGTNLLYNLGKKRFVTVVDYDPTISNVLYGLLNENGELMGENTFRTFTTYFSDGLAGATDMNNKAGYINTDGKWVIDPTYYAAAMFGDGVAWVQETQGGQWILIDKSGSEKFRLEEGFEPMGVYDNGVGYVVKTNFPSEYRYLDKDGNTIYFWGF